MVYPRIGRRPSIGGFNRDFEVEMVLLEEQLWIAPDLQEEAVDLMYRQAQAFGGGLGKHLCLSDWAMRLRLCSYSPPHRKPMWMLALMSKTDSRTKFELTFATC